MKVWCAVHDSPIEGSILGNPKCHKRLWFDVCDDPVLPKTPCSVTEMQLVPADARIVSGEAIVIEKINGEWPKWARHAIVLNVTESWDEEAARVLDALVEPPPKDPWDYDP